MEYIYSPWRAKYFEEPLDGCVFCDISLNPNDDEKNFVFYRDESCFCVMNRYPYTPGHFLVIPHSHLDSISLLDSGTWLHLNVVIQKCVAMLEEFGSEGVNLGVNMKKAAGAGIPNHLHIHLIPRFSGDTNFFTTISECRTFGVDFKAIYEKIKLLATKHLSDINPPLACKG